MKKLVQAVKNNLTALADAMETLQVNIIVFRYQLRHISRGKYKLDQYLDAAKLALAEYLELVQKIKSTIKERKFLLAEKKETSFCNVAKQKKLSIKIEELAKDLEELKSEKAVLLSQLDGADDTGIAVAKKDIAFAAHRIQSAYGEKYNLLLMFDSKRDVTEMLHGEEERHAYQQKLEQQKQQKHKPTKEEQHRQSEQER